MYTGGIERVQGFYWTGPQEVPFKGRCLCSCTFMFLSFLSSHYNFLGTLHFSLYQCLDLVHSHILSIVLGRILAYSLLNFPTRFASLANQEHTKVLAVLLAFSTLSQLRWWVDQQDNPLNLFHPLLHFSLPGSTDSEDSHSLYFNRDSHLPVFGTLNHWMVGEMGEMPQSVRSQTWSGMVVRGKLH